MKKILIISFLVLLIDQLTKIYIKTNFYLGEDVAVFDWFHIAFVENPGMAYGFHFGGLMGKIVLTVFRIFLIIGIIWYVNKWVTKLNNNYFIIPIALILSGAIGNVLDSVFYGILFDKGTIFDSNHEVWRGYQGLAKLDFSGYSGWLSGCVVDMLYFPLVEFNWPNWLPVLGGQNFKFFQPVFNVADTAISIGGASLFIFRNKAFTKK